jgi:hypothetical protein
MLLLEPVAYPWAALCFYLVARALVTRGRVDRGAVAPAWSRHSCDRSSSCIVAGAVAAAALFWFTARGAALRRNWSRGTGRLRRPRDLRAASCDVIVAHQTTSGRSRRRTAAAHARVRPAARGCADDRLGVLPIDRG